MNLFARLIARLAEPPDLRAELERAAKAGRIVRVPDADGVMRFRLEPLVDERAKNGRL